MRIKEIFFPKRSDEQILKNQLKKFKLTMQAYYLTIVIAFASAFIKLSMGMGAGSFVAEELIIILPMAYYALRSISSDQIATRNLRAREANPLLLLFSLISGIITALLIAAAFFAQIFLAKEGEFTSDSLGICLVAGMVGGFLFYFGIRFFFKLGKKHRKTDSKNTDS
ncbi:MAG: hypothetical protein FWD39_00285 [Clostridiales bacterium]|nr:hypothetical protein [Clostridiales bacterium]